MKYLLFIVLLVAVILSVGCTVATVEVNPGTVTYQQPATVSTYSTYPQSTGSTYSPPSATPLTFHIGEPATNGKIQITVNSVKFNDKIENMVPQKEGYHWLTVDVTFINSDTSEIVHGGYFSLIDADGFSYDEGKWSNFEKPLFSFGNRDVLPGETRRGYVYFAIPKTSNALKLKYNFGQGQIAVFDLGSTAISNSWMSISPVQTGIFDTLTDVNSELRYLKISAFITDGTLLKNTAEREYAKYDANDEYAKYLFQVSQLGKDLNIWGQAWHDNEKAVALAYADNSIRDLDQMSLAILKMKSSDKYSSFSQDLGDKQVLFDDMKFNLRRSKDYTSTYLR